MKELTIQEIARALRTGRVLVSKDEKGSDMLRFQGLDNRFYRVTDEGIREKTDADDVLRILSLPYLRWFYSE